MILYTNLAGIQGIPVSAAAERCATREGPRFPCGRVRPKAKHRRYLAAEPTRDGSPGFRKDLPSKRQAWRPSSSHAAFDSAAAERSNQRAFARLQTPN